jgi:hypothetical protein
MATNKLAPKIGFILSVLLFIFALGLYFHYQSAQEQWIWPKKTSALGFSFVGAWFAGGVAPLIYSGLFRQLSPLRGLALAGLVSTGGSAYFLYSKQDIIGNDRYLPFSILFALAFLGIIYVFIKSNRGYLRDDNSVSPVIRWAFLLFSILLFFFGLGLVLNKPHIFPLALAPDMQDIYGWFFLGSCAYFFYGFLKPSRYNVTGPMLSFLVYDLLLIPPYLQYTADVPPELQTSLTIYLSVLFVSALFSFYYLFFDYRTRMFR